MTELQEEIIEFYKKNPCVNYLKFKIIPRDDGSVHLELPVEEIHTNLYGIIHGGILTTMADTAMGASCLVCNKKVVTLSLTMDFIHSVSIGTRIIATARVLHDGAHIMNCESELKTEKGNLVAKSTATFYVLDHFLPMDD